MKKLFLVFMALVAVIITGCMREQIVTRPDGTIYPDSILKISYGGKAPKFAKDGLPNSEFQLKAYKAAHRDVSQAGHWFGGFFFSYGFAMAEEWYINDKRPSFYDLQNIPSDSIYYYDRYYAAEVRRIRAKNAWSGAIVSHALYLIIVALILLGNQ